MAGTDTQLPVPDYDRVLLRDLPARLVALSPSQLRQLIDHERQFAARPQVLDLLHQQWEAHTRRDSYRGLKGASSRATPKPPDACATR